MSIPKSPPTSDLLAVKLSQPAHRALAGAGIKSLAQLAKRTEAEVLALHGVGPTAIPEMKAALKAKGLMFKSTKPAKAAPKAALKPTAKTAAKPAKKTAGQAASSAAASAASKQIDAYLAGLGDWRGAMLSRIRKVVLAAVPDVIETWKWNVPVWGRNGNIVAASAMKQYVKINFFFGASLADPQKLFNAGLESKVMRSIDIHPNDKLNEAGLKALLAAAAALDGAKG